MSRLDPLEPEDIVIRNHNFEDFCYYARHSLLMPRRQIAARWQERTGTAVPVGAVVMAYTRARGRYEDHQFQPGDQEATVSLEGGTDWVIRYHDGHPAVLWIAGEATGRVLLAHQDLEVGTDLVVSLLETVRPQTWTLGTIAAITWRGTLERG